MTRDAITLWTGGGLVAAGAVVSALLTNWLAARRDRRRHEHEQAMALEARRQERLEKAYLDLLTYLSYTLDWLRSVQPIWGPVRAPEPVPPEERRRIEALVTAYGSPEVLRLLREWSERAAKVERVDEMVRLRDASKDPGQNFDAEVSREHRALPGYKRAMVEADKAIRDRVQQELAGEV